MKNKLMITSCLSAFITFTAPFALADAPQTQPGDMVKVLDDLKSSGYPIVKKIEFNTLNGAYNATVVNGEGRNLDIQINPQSGEMTRLKNDVEGLKASDVAKKVQEAGFANIYEMSIGMFGNKYYVKVINDKGQKITLTVDGKTGNILNKPNSN